MCKTRLSLERREKKNAKTNPNSRVFAQPMRFWLPITQNQTQLCRWLSQKAKKRRTNPPIAVSNWCEMSYNASPGWRVKLVKMS
jgi:hypothetical protein